MAKEFSRGDRLASQIHRELSQLISRSLKDPRLAQPSILDVQVTRDLSSAKVFFSVLDPEDSATTLLALKHSAGFLQRELGKAIKSRLTPKLNFIYDDTDIRGRTMDELIDSVIAKDKSNPVKD